MSFPLFDLTKDLAVARGNDPDPDSRFIRRRIASAAWLLGAGLIWLLAAWLHSWIVGVAGIVLLLVGLWLFAERAEQIAALVRRRLERTRDR